MSERPRERLTHYGAGALSLTELLAVVIGSGHADDHALRVAEKLMLTFGTASQLAKANAVELQQAPGIGGAKAARIQAAIELGKRALGMPPADRPRVVTPADAASLLMPDMQLLEQEHVRVMLLDTRNTVIHIPTIYIGSLNATTIRVGELFRPAIRHNAAAIIMVHNHPSGDAAPSPEDINMTRIVNQAGQLLGIDLLDHLIIGHNQYVSLRQRGLGFDAAPT